VRGAERPREAGAPPASSGPPGAVRQSGPPDSALRRRLPQPETAKPARHGWISFRSVSVPASAQYTRELLGPGVAGSEVARCLEMRRRACDVAAGGLVNGE